MTISRLALIAIGALASMLASHPASAAEPSLKDIFASDFKIGVALSNDQLLGKEPAAMELVRRQFNCTTPENCLKWGLVHPEPDKYDFEAADKYVEFGEKNGMYLIGHTLVWHNQTPNWVFEDENGKPLSRDKLIERMRDHIHTVVGRYKGRIKGWDVVNEAILENGDMRPTKWQQIIGDDYLEMAYKFAHEADPDAQLYYNEYHEWMPSTRQGIIKLIKNLQAKGIKVGGLGLQGHWGMNEPSMQKVEAMIEDYAQLGIPLMITELDIKLVPPAQGEAGAVDGTSANVPELSEENQKVLAQRYAEIFKLLLKHKDKFNRVTFWGVHDGQSWHNYHPQRGNPAYPLLFDRKLQPKPAFWSVIETAKN